ncbi:hypothetical protein CU014_0914 [Enterococcus xinjiangensis]|uniref:hypothetical protein n=1 Tax=Enterococcus lactis TaxID=357441 RepID=UPI00192C839E|nr:hypothetical protein [Enterococcus lactis]MBL4997082.1 hypothetical protein [Enterococcus lactis]
MELLEKESIDFYLERAWTVLRYAFFKEEEYDGLNSHQEAVLEFLNEEFNQLNDRLFPDKDHLHIYLWNNEFTNYYNEGRYWDGAYVWSVYDEKRKRFTVFDASLVMI